MRIRYVRIVERGNLPGRGALMCHYTHTYEPDWIGPGVRPRARDRRWRVSIRRLPDETARALRGCTIFDERSNDSRINDGFDTRPRPL